MPRVSSVQWMFHRVVVQCLMKRSFEGWIHCVRRVERRMVDVEMMDEWRFVVIWNGVGWGGRWFCSVDVFANLSEKNCCL